MRYLISADNQHVSSCCCLNEMRIKQSVSEAGLSLWNLSELCLGMYSRTDEGAVGRVAYVTLPWLSPNVTPNSPRGKGRLQVAAVSSGCDASLHRLLPDLRG